MRDQTWQYSSSADSHLIPTDTDFWLWEGHPKSFQPSDVTAETKQDALSWACKLGKVQHRFEMQYAGTSAPGSMDDDQQQQQQQQFVDYWSREDDRILSPYMPGYQAQQSRPHSPALSSGLASSLREGKLPAHSHHVFVRTLLLYAIVSDICQPCFPTLQAYKHADMMQPKGNMNFPEELADDYLLMESLDLPPASVLPR